MKILTWNILGGGDYKKEIEYIKNVNPDIFCLQEVQVNYPGYYDGRVDVLTELRESFPNYHISYAPINHRVHNGVEQAFGNAICSKFKIVNEQALYFRKPADWTPNDHQNQSRNILIVKINTGARILTVATGHLTYEPFFMDTPQQEEEAVQIVEKLKREANVVLCGDFNSLPESKVIKIISEKFRQVPGQDSLTFARIPWGYNGFNVNNLQFKLDYMFHSPEIKSENILLPDTDSSDHLPLAAEITITA